MVDESALYDMVRQALWAAVSISAPILTVALVVGLAIGLLQALTSIQEMTLTFVPKLASIVIAFWLSIGVMGRTLDGFFTDQIIPMIAGIAK